MIVFVRMKTKRGAHLSFRVSGCRSVAKAYGAAMADFYEDYGPNEIVEQMILLDAAAMLDTSEPPGNCKEIHAGKSRDSAMRCEHLADSQHE